MNLEHEVGMPTLLSFCPYVNTLCVVGWMFKSKPVCPMELLLLDAVG